MKEITWYEVLEVSENASPEVIEKAYKILAKKYHPDLQDESKKQYAENKMKQINQAYEIVGNAEKRKEYDIKLIERRNTEKIQQQEKYGYNIRENKNNNQNDLNYEKEKYIRKLKREEEIQREKMQERLNKEYENAYYNYLESLGYKVKNKWKKENFKDLIIVIIIMIIIFAILWFIPPTHDWMVDFYKQNPILKTIIDIVVSIISGIFRGIWNFIIGLFN